MEYRFVSMSDSRKVSSSPAATVARAMGRRLPASAGPRRRLASRPMADRDEIVSFLDTLLDARDWPDYGPNGLQVPGTREVERVVTGVSAHAELFERAATAGAQLVLCHHGILWDKVPRTISTAQKRRLRALFEADLSLAAYHLPLDAHPEVGNNALICAELGLEAFVTGEPSEPAMADAREGGVHFVAAGHYATETFGVRRLGELLAERFEVEHVFVDVPNPV